MRLLTASILRRGRRAPEAASNKDANDYSTEGGSRKRKKEIADTGLAIRIVHDVRVPEQKPKESSSPSQYKSKHQREDRQDAFHVGFH
jgi:hypothetical protein